MVMMKRVCFDVCCDAVGSSMCVVSTCMSITRITFDQSPIVWQGQGRRRGSMVASGCVSEGELLERPDQPVGVRSVRLDGRKGNIQLYSPC